ncbi:F-box/LRR-repeat protein 6 isoform X1 [Haliaeetus albicilla]|uniref:F-box/LRR-repeat protein 6 isoform X1 n=1 Tax=Haliaeetus albicilla TaxID=8969 RepID=UPI0037E73FE5
MAAGGGPIPPGPTPQVTAVGRRDTPTATPAPRPAPRRRHRRRLAAPNFLVHRTADDVLLILPVSGGSRRPPRAAPPRKRRRREEEGEEEEGGEEEAAAGPQSAWGSRLPPEILVRIFQAAVEQEGAVPFLCRWVPGKGAGGALGGLPHIYGAGGVAPPTATRSPPPQGRPRVPAVVRGRRRTPALAQGLAGGVLGGADPRAPAPHPAEGAGHRALAGGEQEFVLCGWKSHVGFVLQALGERCPLLGSLALRRCGGVPAQPLACLPPRCPRLHRLELRHCQVEPSAVAAFLGAAGPRLRQLCLSCGPRLGTVLAALASGCCPDLRLLELDTALGGTGPPLPLPVERLQAACPHLQVLRLLNLSWTARGSRRADPPGFPRLEELSLAGAGGVGVGDEVLRRLLRASGRLRLLDLRGCTRVTPRALLELPCDDLEQLYLGLPCGAEELPRLTEGSAELAWKWRRSLRELDLAGRSFGQQDLARAMAAFGPGSPLRSLNLAGTKVTPGALSALLPACRHLAYLNLSSCRHLPRGTKRPHRGCREVRRCLRVLAGRPPDEENPDEDPPEPDAPDEPLRRPEA